MYQITKITHWLPIITFCPVNNLPDPIFITVTFVNEFVELYAARKRIRKIISGKRMFMEEIAQRIAHEYPGAEVEVRLWFSKHTVTIKRDI